jgi:RimJ/RimL family protein N-acetyltransferase
VRLDVQVDAVHAHHGLVVVVDGADDRTLARTLTDGAFFPKNACPTSAAAPLLETDRLRLRGHRVGDFSDLAAMWGDPVVVRHIGGRPSTREESWSRLLRYGGLWPLLGFGIWAVEERATGRYVGDVGFADFQRDITPSFEGAPEAGWILPASAHGRGYATEAVRAALAWLDANLAGARAVCLIDPGNDASLRVASKCGFVEYARATYKGEPGILLRR